MPLFKYLAIVAFVSFPTVSSAFSWEMYLPAITECDSYPFSSCKARSLCKSDGKHWYDGKCNDEKHLDQVLLEKIDGTWESPIYRFRSSCSGEYAYFWYHPFATFEKDLIADDNSQVVQFEGNVFSIMSKDYWPPSGCSYDPTGSDCDRPPYYQYAILDQSEYTYLFKDININWGSEGYCYLEDGTKIIEYSIKSGDTGLYYFDLTPDSKMVGKAHFVNADVWFNLVEEIPQQ